MQIEVGEGKGMECVPGRGEKAGGEMHAELRDCKHHGGTLRSGKKDGVGVGGSGVTLPKEGSRKPLLRS